RWTEKVGFGAAGGGKVGAAGGPLFGRDSVLKLLLGIRRGAVNHHVTLSMNVIHVNGEPAIVVSVGGRIDSVYVCSIADDKIVALHVVRNPDKLQYLKGQLRG